jgi:hypothetical protein
MKAGAKTGFSWRYPYNRFRVHFTRLNIQQYTRQRRGPKHAERRGQFHPKAAYRSGQAESWNVTSTGWDHAIPGRLATLRGQEKQQYYAVNCKV